jgi:ribose 1,5-bisphosphokinase
MATSPNKGGFVFVVGPSGAGKDSLIGFARGAFSGNDRIVFPRRIVTRASSQHEDHDSLDDAAFAEGEASGAFTLCWRAHGLGYAIPKSAREETESGKIAICNISRRVVPWTRVHLPNVTVVEVTAPAEVLAARLAGRARLEDGDLAARLARSLEVWTEVDASIVNDRSIDEGGRELVSLINAHAEKCAGTEDRLVPRFG